MKATSPLFQILRSHPLFPIVDLSRSTGKYVIVDPMNSSNLLYVTEKYYLRLVAVAMSNDDTLTTLIVPGDVVVAGPDGRPIKSSPIGESPSEDDSSITPDLRESLVCPIRAIPLSEEDTRFQEWTENPMLTMTEGDLFDNLLLANLAKIDYESLVRRFRLSVSTDSFWISKIQARPSRKPYYLRGKLSYHTRSEYSPNFLEARTDNIGPILREWGITLHLRIMGRVPNDAFITSFIRMLSILRDRGRTRGMLDTLQFMKNSYLYCVAYLAGQRHSDPWMFGTPVALASGLPSWLPAPVRLQLRSGNLKYWKWVLSFLFSYKGLITSAPLPTLATIEAPLFDEDKLTPFLEYFPKFAKFVLSRFKGTPVSLTPPAAYHKSWWTKIGCSLDEGAENILEVLTSGPNGRPSVTKAGLDALAWYAVGHEPLIRWMEMTKNFLVLALFKASYYQALDSVQFFEPLSSFPPVKEDLQKGWFLLRNQSADGRPTDWLQSVKNLMLGRLSLKPEAAGKVRVFAISDYWTQCVMSPLHRKIFAFLEYIPGDATMNQGLVFDEFCRSGNSIVTCYDLSSATDMLSTKIQIKVLSEFIGLELAELWAKILCDRDYAVPRGTAYPKSSIRYTRGQPIGALSSWAILALTHHFLVYCAASRVGVQNYTNYVVCGDDIALGGMEVPASYLALCQELEIPISIPKSLVSSSGESKILDGPLVSFVSRLKANETDVTPWSLKEEISITDTAARVESVARRVRRGQILLDSSWLSSLVKSSVTRYSDIERVARSFTSGKMTDAIIEVVAPLLFPSTDPSVLGLKEGDISLWLAVVTGMPGVVSLDASALKNGIALPKDFPLKTFVQEMFLIVWSRILVSYDIVSANTRLFTSWVATMNSLRTSRRGVCSHGFLTTSLLTQIVLHKRICREQSQMNRSITSILDLFNMFRLPTADSVPACPPHRLGTEVCLKILKEVLRITLDSPSPERLGFRTVHGPELFGNMAQYSAEHIASVFGNAPKESILKGSIPITPVPVGKGVQIPDPLIHRTAMLEEITLGSSLSPLDSGSIPDNLRDIVKVLKDWCYRTYLPCQLPDFPTISEWALDPNIPPSSAELWSNPIILPDSIPVIGDDSYAILVSDAMTWFRKSQFRSDPLPPILTSQNCVVNPFIIKEVNKTSFGISRIGKAFNRTIELIIQSKGLLMEEGQ